MSKTRHLSRLAAPKTWPIKKKGSRWIAKPSPGAHNISNSLPLVILLRDVLGLAKTKREVGRILHNKEVLVNGKPRTDKRFSAGLLDVISIPRSNKHYRIVLNKYKKLSLLPIPETEAKLIPLKLRDKTKINRGKTQLNFTNGWNLVVDKDDYASNNVLMFDTSKNKITNRLKLDKGNIVYFVSGKHASKIAKLKEIKETGVLKKEKIAVVTDGKDEWETLVKTLITIGKTKPMIKVK